MSFLNRFISLFSKTIAPSLITCLAVVPSYSIAATINVLSEDLHVSLQALEETYLYDGSGFSAPGFDSVASQTLLPNYNLDKPVTSGFSSMFWWNTHKLENGFRLFGDANTDRGYIQGDYSPDIYTYARSILSFDMLFSVDGDGAMLSANTIGGSWGQSFSTVTMFDLTTGTQFLGGALTSGHDYSVNAWAQSVNGGGDEKIFQLTFADTEFVVSVAEPTTLLIMVTGLFGLSLVGQRRRKFHRPAFLT